MNLLDNDVNLLLVRCGAKTVNARLRSTRFETMTTEEGLDRLVQVLLAAKGEDEDDAWQALQNTTRVEMAIVDAGRKCLQRPDILVVAFMTQLLVMWYDCHPA